MGVTIHYVIGMQSGNVKRALDRTQALANEMKREQAAPLGVPFSIRRPSPSTLLIDIGGCETLAFKFDTLKGFERVGQDGQRAWSYERSVVARYFAPAVLGSDDDPHYQRWPEQKPVWAAAFCKTQYASSLAEHRFVAELIRSVASVAQYAHVYDEGDYYHTLEIEDAAEAIHENGVLINALGSKLNAAFGAENVVRGGETKIKPTKKQTP